MSLASIGIEEIRRTKGFKHKGEQIHRVTGQGDDGTEVYHGKYIAEYSPEGQLVTLDVETNRPRCRHRFYLTWPQLRLEAYMVMSCQCSTTTSSQRPQLHNH